MLNVLLTALVLAPASLTVKVEGDGYLRFAREGRVCYATQATFHVAEGHLVTANGAEPLPAVKVPASTEGIQIDLEGNVTATGQGQKWLVGRLVLGLFAKDASLTPDGDFLLASDRPTLGNPGEGVNGVIRTVGVVQPVPAKTTPTVTTPVIHSAPSVSPKTVAVTSPKKSTFAPGAAEIMIRAEAIVPGETFTLGDIAEIHADDATTTSLSAVDLGHAPVVGVQRGMDTSFVMSKIRTAGYKVDKIIVSCPPAAHILRASQTVGRQQFLDTATAAIRDQLGIDLPMRLSNDVADAVVPVGQLEIRAATAFKNTNGVSLMIEVRVDDKRFTSRNLTLSPASGAGTGVKAGQEVKITVHLHGATIEVNGRARTAAWVGQTVTVVTDTGAVKTAIVTGPDTVEVKL